MPKRKDIKRFEKF